MKTLVFTGGIWLAGVFSFFSPCILPVLPVYFGILSEEPGSSKLKLLGYPFLLKPVLKTLFFIAGLATVFITLGFGATLLGSFLTISYLPTIMGGIVIILGLHQMGIINFKFMQNQKKLSFKRRRFNGLFGAYLLGFTFSFGWTPCIGPVLSAILAISLTGSQSLVGGALMGVYTIGLAIPFLVLSILSVEFFQRFSGVKSYMGKIKKIGGLVIVIMGIVLLFDQVNFLTSLFT